MIDISQLTSLISAFRVETEKESISPETVGSILQDITDLLSTASTDAEHQILENWKNMLSQYYFVYDVADANIPDQQNIFLRLRARNLGDGSSYSASVPIGAASSRKAGAMTAEHVQSIMALQTAVSNLQTAVNALQTESNAHSQQLLNIQTAGYVVTGIDQGNPHSSRVNLRITQHDVRTGEDFVFDGSTYLTGATAEKAGAMTAEQVNSLAIAKTDITTLQAAMRKVKGAGCVVDGAQVYQISANSIEIMLFGYNLATGEREVELQRLTLPAASHVGAGLMTATQVNLLDALRQTVFGANGTATVHSFYNFGITIGTGRNALYLRGAKELLRLGFVPYLFRYSRKRNRTKDMNGHKSHGDIRKGWNVVGKAETLSIGSDETVKIDKEMFVHEEFTDEQLEEMEQYQPEARFFISDRLDVALNIRYVPFGKTRVNLELKQLDNSYKLRKVRLQYGIAFASYRVGKRDLLDKSKLVTPIVPFHISNVPDNGTYRWVFER